MARNPIDAAVSRKLPENDMHKSATATAMDVAGHQSKPMFARDRKETE